MPINPETGLWQPLLSQKQMEVFNDRHIYLMVDGPRRSGKTVACLHRLVRHAWEVPGARIAIFARTRKSAEQGGIWSDLLQTIIPEWVAGGFGFKILQGPKIDGATRLAFFDVTDAHGGASRVQLHSLDFDGDVEAAVRGTRFSMVYFSELSNFKDRIVFVCTSEQLRYPGLAHTDHMWLADTNPAPEGEESTWYQLFYKERLQEKHPFPNIQKHFHAIRISIEDNPFITQEEKDSISARHSHDADLYSRYVLGKWTKRSDVGLFSDVFLASTHVVGVANSLNEDDWDVLLPTENCSKLLTGWDLGSKNHSMHLAEKLGSGNRCVFHVLDEVVALNTTMPIGDFTEIVTNCLEIWEAVIRQSQPNDIEYKHWSDQSAFDQYRAALGGYDHNVVAVASEGKIMLMAAPKGKGSIFKRIDILRRLLYQNRIFISAKCKETIRMLGNISKGQGRLEPVEDSPLRHIFDSLTYMVSAECYAELNEEWAGGQAIRTGPIVSIKL